MRFDTLDQWLHWQETLHPSEIELGLERLAPVYQRLALNFSGVTVITIAGTNGKGSCGAMLGAILHNTTHRVGTYSSPHLIRYNERISVDGEVIDDAALCSAFDVVDRARRDVSLTYFEFGTLAALVYFARRECDVLLLEVGLGGRLDAVNIVDPSIALITTIDLDHMEWLGSSRNEIALEKAGILRKAIPLVCGEIDPPSTLLQKVDELGVPAKFLKRDFDFTITPSGWRWSTENQQYEGLPMPSLQGEFQCKNAACVIMVLHLLKSKISVNQQQIAAGLQNIVLLGRLQQIGQRPQMLVDVAHNPEAARALEGVLAQSPCKGETHAVFAVLANKDAGQIIESLSNVVDVWHIAPLKHPAGLPVQALVKHLKASANSLRYNEYTSITSAWNSVKKSIRPEDRMIGFGSFYCVAEILALE